MVDVTYGRPLVKTFKDRTPVMGQDPHIVQWNGSFLLIQSAFSNTRIVIKQFEHLSDMNRNQSHTVWIEAKHQQLWAPEIWNLDGKWYIYYAASVDGTNEDHRMYVLEADHPLGPYHSLGKVITPDDYWAIDQTILHHEGDIYALWSGWDENSPGFPQHLYGAPLLAPNRIGDRYLLASPDLNWEKSVAPIIEGPQVLSHERLFISYSANASWAQEYSVGLLEYTGASVLDPQAWTKLPDPFLTGGGHGSFFDFDNETYYCYHRKLSHEPGWNDREIRYTKVEWNLNGYPRLADS